MCCVPQLAVAASSMCQGESLAVAASSMCQGESQTVEVGDSTSQQAYIHELYVGCMAAVYH